jgi:hypothetical protein
MDVVRSSPPLGSGGYKKMGCKKEARDRPEKKEARTSVLASGELSKELRSQPLAVGRPFWSRWHSGLCWNDWSGNDDWWSYWGRGSGGCLALRSLKEDSHRSATTADRCRHVGDEVGVQHLGDRPLSVA